MGVVFSFPASDNGCSYDGPGSQLARHPRSTPLQPTQALARFRGSRLGICLSARPLNDRLERPPSGHRPRPRRGARLLSCHRSLRFLPARHRKISELRARVLRLPPRTPLSFIGPEAPLLVLGRSQVFSPRPGPGHHRRRTSLLEHPSLPAGLVAHRVGGIPRAACSHGANRPGRSISHFLQILPAR